MWPGFPRDGLAQHCHGDARAQRGGTEWNSWPPHSWIVRAVCGQGLKGTSESWLWLTQETSDIFTSVQTRREERPALVTRQLVLAVGPFRLHVPTFPSFLSPKNISHHVHLPLTFSVLLSGVVFPRPVLCGKGAPEPRTHGRTSCHVTARTHAHFDLFADTWHMNQTLQTCIVCSLHHAARSWEEPGSEEHMKQRMHVVKMI